MKQKVLKQLLNTDNDRQFLELMHMSFHARLGGFVDEAHIEHIFTFYTRAMKKIMDEESERSCLYSIDRSRTLTWASPRLLNLISEQFRQALIYNSHQGQYCYKPSALVREATTRAERNLQAFFGPGSEHTPYYLEATEKAERRSKTIEIARILVWPEAVLLSALGQQVVDLHRNMHIPCFFIRQEDFPITSHSGHEFFIATPPDRENCLGDAATHIFLDDHNIRQRKEEEEDPLVTFRKLLLSDKVYLAADYQKAALKRK